MNISKYLTQTAVYWGTPANDGYGGFTYAAPVEISCRWEDKQEVFTNSRGIQEVSRAVVYINQDMDLDGRLYLGTLDDLDSAQSHTSVDSCVIKAYSKVPNLRGTVFIRKVWL